MSKTVCVSGSHGFIGRYVTRALAEAGWQVTGLHKRGYADDPKHKHDGLTEHVHDLNHPIQRPIFTDAIVNLAAESHVDKSIAQPVPFILNNVCAALNMLEMARMARPKMFIQVSTDEVFGPAPEGVYHDEWDRHIPSSPYSSSKSCQEMIAISYWRTYSIPVVIIRLMNNFGPGQNAEKMVPKTVQLLKAGKPVPVHAERTLDQRVILQHWKAGSRTWLHAANAADAIRFILEHVEPQRYPSFDRPSCFHIAGDEEIDNAELVRRAAAILNVEAKIEYVDVHSSRPGHDRRYALSSKRMKEIGWVPPKDFETSFKETVLELAK